jgi:adenylate kinase
MDQPQVFLLAPEFFSERGFHATVDVTRIGVPLRVDLKTGEIHSQEKKVFRFSVRFRNPEIRG